MQQASHGKRTHLQQRSREELADERRGQAHGERLVVVVRVLGEVHDAFRGDLQGAGTHREQDQEGTGASEQVTTERTVKKKPSMKRAGNDGTHREEEALNEVVFRLLPHRREQLAREALQVERLSGVELGHQRAARAQARSATARATERANRSLLLTSTAQVPVGSFSSGK
jgi:hypothetical protein